MKFDFTRPFALALFTGLLASITQSDCANAAASGAIQDPVAGVYADVKATLGIVPEFIKAMPRSGVSGIWHEWKGLLLDSHTAIPSRFKELIALGAAAQLPCDNCTYLHKRAAKLNGALDEEVREAIGIAGASRHWATLLSGTQVDEAHFRSEALQIAAHRKVLRQRSAPQAVGTALHEMELELGTVPQFMRNLPPQALAGAWAEMRDLELNPKTTIPAKYKRLIALATAAQIPCAPLVFAETEGARAEGASEEEIREGVAVAAVARNLATLINSSQLDPRRFRKEADLALVHLKRRTDPKPTPQQLAGQVGVESSVDVED